MKMERNFFLVVLILFTLSGAFALDAESLIGFLGDAEDRASYFGDIETAFEGGFFGAPNNISLSLFSVDGLNLTTSDLNCSGFLLDNEGDDMNVSVRWYRNSVLNLSLDYNNSYANGTMFYDILSSENTSKGDTWVCSARAYDGMFYGEWSNSSGLTIGNELPNVTLISPNDWNVTMDRSPSFAWVGYDADGDSLTYEIRINEHKYSGVKICNDDISENALAIESYTPTSDLLCLYDNGYYYNWSVRAHDGTEWGNWSEVWHFNMTAEVSINLVSSEVSFGSMIFGDSLNTSDDNPTPFVIDNDGNVVTNVSVNSSAIWGEAVNDSSYYQFKADNTTAELGTFNWMNSIVDWFNMPITGEVVAIGELKYADGEDSAEIDIRLEVPENEAPGVKSATILFTGVLSE